MAPVDKIHPWSPDEAGSERYRGGAVRRRVAGRYGVHEFAAARPDRRDPARSEDARPRGRAERARSSAGRAHRCSRRHDPFARRADVPDQGRGDGGAARDAPASGCERRWVGLVVAVIVAAVLGFWLFGQTSVLVKSAGDGLRRDSVPARRAWSLGQSTRTGSQSPLGISPGRRRRAWSSKQVTATMTFAVEAVMDAAARCRPAVMYAPARGASAGTRPSRASASCSPRRCCGGPNSSPTTTATTTPAARPGRLHHDLAAQRQRRLRRRQARRRRSCRSRSSSDFFVDLNLPVALTRGDEVGVPVVVYNYLDKPQTVTLTLADADWFTRLDGAEQRLELAPATRSAPSTTGCKVEKVGDWTADRGGPRRGRRRRREAADRGVPDGRRRRAGGQRHAGKAGDVALDVPEDRHPRQRQGVREDLPVELQPGGRGAGQHLPDALRLL